MDCLPRRSKRSAESRKKSSFRLANNRQAGSVSEALRHMTKVPSFKLPKRVAHRCAAGFGQVDENNTRLVDYEICHLFLA